MRIDYIALSLVTSLIVFSAIMYLVFRKQSEKSEHPDAQLSNASNPTLLQHAPPESQGAYSASMLSLSLEGRKEKESGIEGGGETGEGGKEPKRRLFFEDTGPERQGEGRGDSRMGRSASQVV